MEADLLTLRDVPAAAPPNNAAQAVAAGAGALAVQPTSVKQAVLALFSPVEADLTALAKRHDKVVYDLTTPKGLKDARAARHELRENGRFLVQRMLEKTKDQLNDAKKIAASEAERLIAIVKPHEDALHADIEARENEIEQARLADEARKQKHRDAIAVIAGYVEHAKGKPSLKIADGIVYVETIDTSAAVFEEFAEDAAAAQATTLAKLHELHLQAIDAEMQAAEHERIRAENEARERTIRQLGAITAHVSSCLGQGSVFIEDRIGGLDALLPSAAAEQVLQAHATARAQLDAMLSQARQNEAMAAQLAAMQAQQRQAEQDSQRHESGALSDPNATGNGTMAHHTDDAAPVGGQAEGEAAAAAVVSPGSANEAEEREESPLAGGEQNVGEAADLGSLETTEDEARHIPVGDVLEILQQPHGNDAALLRDCLALVEHAAKAFDCRFPSQPKPSVEWWAALRTKVQALEPALKAALAA